jgi:Tfp pilus assembly protein PilV
MTVVKRSGSSLVEVLAAMALALFLLVGAAGMLTWALAAKRRGDVTAALAHAVSDRLDSLKSLPFADAALAPGAYAATVRVEPGNCLVDEAWVIDDDADGVKRVSLTVREASRPGPDTAAVLYVLRDLGFGP